MNADDSRFAIELRWWVMTHLHRRHDGTYVFRDGVSFENLSAAVEAAWLAGDQWLALELAERYNMGNVLCLRCARACSASTRFCSLCALQHLATHA